MGAATLAEADRFDPSRSMAEAAALEAALRAGCNHRRDGARAEAAGRISFRQRHRRLLRLDLGPPRPFARLRLDRGTGLRLAAAMARLHDDAIRPQSRTRRPQGRVSAIPEGGITRHRHSGARVRANPESRDSGFDAFASPRNDGSLLLLRRIAFARPVGLQ